MPETINIGQVIPTLDFHFAKDKDNPDYGFRICSWVSSYLRSGLNNYFPNRNIRMKSDREWASGRNNMASFQDLMSFRGKRAYMNLDFTPPAIMPKYFSQISDTFLSIDDNMKVQAIDERSKNIVDKERKEAIFRMLEKQTIQNVQQSTDMQFLGTDSFTPANMDQLEVFFNEQFRLPEEAMTEEMINDTWAKNKKFYLKQVILKDLMETGLGVLRLVRDPNAQYHILRVAPEDFFYGYSEYPDLRDVSFMGERKNMKVTTFRKLFSQEGFTEKELFMLACNYGSMRPNTKLEWHDSYYTSQFRPYDNWLIPMLRIEIKTDNSLFVKEKVDSDLHSIFDISADRPVSKSSNTVVSEKRFDKIYCGWYLEGYDKMISWKPSTFDIRSPGDFSDQLYSYSPYLCKGVDMQLVSLPSNIKPPVTQMIMAHLRIQQVLAKMKPPGNTYDFSTIKSVVTGNGKALTKDDIKDIHQQTGDIYWGSIGEDGETRLNIPIGIAPNNEGSSQLSLLISVYNFYFERLQEYLGSNPAASGAAINPRMGLGVMKSQILSAQSAVSYIYHAWTAIFGGISEKIGISHWDDIENEMGDFYQIARGKKMRGGFQFNVIVSNTPDDSREFLDAQITAALNGGAIDFSQAFTVRNIKNVKVAEMYLAQMQAKKEQDAQQAAQTNAINNMNAQARAASMNFQGKAAMEEKRYQGKLLSSVASHKSKQDLTLQQFIQNALMESMKTGKPLTQQIQNMMNEYLGSQQNPQTTPPVMQQMDNGGQIQDNSQPAAPMQPQTPQPPQQPNIPSPEAPVAG